MVFLPQSALRSNADHRSDIQGLGVISDVLLRTTISGLPLSPALDQLLQSLRLPCTSYEFVSQQLLGRWPSIRILNKALSDEVLEVLTVLVPFQSRGRCLWNLEKHLHRMRAGIWRLAVDHLDRSDSERPDVRLEVVSSLLDDFRRHPKRRADECVSLGLDVGELRCNSEIRQFDVPLQ